MTFHSWTDGERAPSAKISRRSMEKREILTLGGRPTLGQGRGHSFASLPERNWPWHPARRDHCLCQCTNWAIWRQLAARAGRSGLGRGSETRNWQPVAFFYGASEFAAGQTNSGESCHGAWCRPAFFRWPTVKKGGREWEGRGPRLLPRPTGHEGRRSGGELPIPSADQRQTVRGACGRRASRPVGAVRKSKILKSLAAVIRN
jgi:hypothetical protein